MQPRTPIIERAYELARSGTCQIVSDIKVKLKAEGYANIDSYVDGRKLLRDLRDLCVVSCAAAPVNEPVSD